MVLMEECDVILPIHGFIRFQKSGLSQVSFHVTMENIVKSCFRSTKNSRISERLLDKNYDGSIKILYNSVVAEEVVLRRRNVQY